MQKPPHTGKTTGVSRRNLIIYAASAPVLAHPLATLAEAVPGGIAAQNLKQFTDLSVALTGRNSLSPITAERLFNALDGHHAEFTDALRDLETVSERDPAFWSTEQRELARKIVKGWYLGTVGEGPEADLVAYEHALMFAPVKDALVPRTFCYRKPGYWAEAPVKA